MDVSAGYFWKKSKLMHFYVMCGTALVTLFKRKQEQLIRSVYKI